MSLPVGAAGCGCTLREALFECTSTLATTELSVGVTGPTAAPATLWVEILGMMLGRLEFLVVLVGVIRLGRGFGDYLRRRRASRLQARPGTEDSSTG